MEKDITYEIYETLYNKENKRPYTELYNILNYDSVYVMHFEDDNLFYISYTNYPTKKMSRRGFRQLKRYMKKNYNADYLYDKIKVA